MALPHRRNCTKVSIQSLILSGVHKVYWDEVLNGWYANESPGDDQCTQSDSQIREKYFHAV